MEWGSSQEEQEEAAEGGEGVSHQEEHPVYKRGAKHSGEIKDLAC